MGRCGWLTALGVLACFSGCDWQGIPEAYEPWADHGISADLEGELEDEMDTLDILEISDPGDVAGFVTGRSG